MKVSFKATIIFETSNEKTLPEILESYPISGDYIIAAINRGKVGMVDIIHNYLDSEFVPVIYMKEIDG